MFITDLDVRGFADLPEFQASGWGRAVRLQGASPAGVALGDALELLFAALSPTHLDALLRRWGMLALGEQPEILGEPFPEQAAWTHPGTGADRVADVQQRALTVTATLELDPPLFGALRAEAARQPRLITALAEGPRLTLGVGALFTSSFETVALTLQSVRVGAESFPTLPRERPVWLTRLLMELGRRFHRYDGPDPGLAERALVCATSRELHARYRAWQAALAETLGAARVVRAARGTAEILIDERPLRRWGELGRRTAELAGAVHLSGADVLWADADDPLLLAGVEAGSLEQVIQAAAGDGDVISAAVVEPRRASRFPVRPS